MMIPARPRSCFIVRKTRLTFGPFDRILDQMFRLGHAGKLIKSRIRGGVGKILIILHGPPRLLVPRHDQ